MNTEILNAKRAIINQLHADAADIADARIERALEGRVQISGYLGVANDFTFRNTSITWGTVNGIRCLVAAE